MEEVEQTNPMITLFPTYITPSYRNIQDIKLSPSGNQFNCSPQTCEDLVEFGYRFFSTDVLIYSKKRKIVCKINLN